MELFVLIASFAICAFVVLFFIKEQLAKFNKDYIKSQSFLYMANDGNDPCEKNQVISANVHYCTSMNWITEE